VNDEKPASVGTDSGNTSDGGENTGGGDQEFS
jgi:hypothetical protein